MTTIIGIGHYKRVGKDTLAKAIVNACEDYRLSSSVVPFARPLKDVCHELYGWAGLREADYYETEPGASEREVVLPSIGKSARQIWVDFGTKAVREQVYDRTWLDYRMNNLPGSDVCIIPDVRFQNEAEAIKSAGGVLVKVVRPGFAPGQDVADRALLGYEGWDWVVGGGRCEDSLEELRTCGRYFASMTRTGHWFEQNGGNRDYSLRVEAEAIKASSSKETCHA